jgi:hypothetical protein
MVPVDSTNNGYGCVEKTPIYRKLIRIRISISRVGSFTYSPIPLYPYTNALVACQPKIVGLGLGKGTHVKGEGMPLTG